MREKLVRNIIETLFVARYWAVFILFSCLVIATIYVSKSPTIEIRDVVAVFTGGLVVITVLYHFLNYEYNQRKFKHEIKSSKNLLSFNTVVEWQKEHMTNNINCLYSFYIKHKDLLDNGLYSDFHVKLLKPKNEKSYTALLVVINFLESVCLAVKHDIMDEHFIQGFFGSVFSTQYHRYKGYIEYRRKVSQNNKIWLNFTILSEKWITCN